MRRSSAKLNKNWSGGYTCTYASFGSGENLKDGGAGSPTVVTYIHRLDSKTTSQESVLPVVIMKRKIISYKNMFLIDIPIFLNSTTSSNGSFKSSSFVESV